MSVCRASRRLYKDAKNIMDPEVRHKQIVPIAKMPTLAAAATGSASGCRSLTDNSLGFTANFLDDVEGG